MEHMIANKKRGQPAPAPKTSIAKRLEHVRATNGLESLLEFHQRLTAPHGSREGPFDVSYSAVRNYHFDREPPLSYLRRVAEVFGVRLAWLVTGEGEPEPPPVGTQDLPERMWARVRAKQAAAEEDWIESLDLGEAEIAERRKAAVRRFAQMLTDARYPGAPWEDTADRYMLLRSAGEFLKGVDEAFETSNPPFPPKEGEEKGMSPTMGGILLRNVEAKAWWVHWYDQALTLFAERVRGLGVRTGGVYDSAVL
jgi:hypothetical protein